MPTWPAVRGRSGSFRPVSVFVKTSHSELLVLLAELGQDGVVLQGRRVAERLLAGGDVAEKPPHDLAAAGLREGIGEADVVGAGERADLLGDVLLQGLLERLAGGLAGLQGHERREG